MRTSKVWFDFSHVMVVLLKGNLNCKKNGKDKSSYFTKRNSGNQSYFQDKKDHKYIVSKSKGINCRRVP